MKKRQVLFLLLFLIVIAAVFPSCSVRNEQPAELPPTTSTTQNNTIASDPDSIEKSEPESPPDPPAPPASADNTEAANPSESAAPAEPAPLPEPTTSPIEAPSTEVPTTEVSSSEVTSAEAPSAEVPSAEMSSSNSETGSSYHKQVPILMYHEVNDLLANDLYLSVEDFTAHLAYFQENGITPISMQQLYDHWYNGGTLPETPIVLTFDDGYRSMYTTVYPLLKERGWSGTFYCITDARWSDNFVLEEMIAEMAAGGMEIGSHTVSHVELHALSGDHLHRELTESKEILSSLTGKDVNMLCYPAGRHNEETKTAAAEAGYLCSVTTNYGVAAKSQGMHGLKRIRVNRGCGASWLQEVLSPLGY